jgi:hypothetical protein
MAAMMQTAKDEIRQKATSIISLFVASSAFCSSTGGGGQGRSELRQRKSVPIACFLHIGGWRHRSQKSAASWKSGPIPRQADMLNVHLLAAVLRIYANISQLYAAKA